MYKIAIFASGSGSNAQVCTSILKEVDLRVEMIVTNNSKAGVISRFKEKNSAFSI